MTDTEKAEVYKTFLHKLAICYGISMNSERVKEGLDLVWDWYRAHSYEGGDVEYEDMQQRVESVLQRMEEW